MHVKYANLNSFCTANHNYLHVYAHVTKPTLTNHNILLKIAIYTPTYFLIKLHENTIATTV